MPRAPGTVHDRPPPPQGFFCGMSAEEQADEASAADARIAARRRRMDRWLARMGVLSVG